MGVLGKAFSTAGDAASSAFKKVKEVTVSASAANKAHEANENLKDARDAAAGKAHGTLYKIGDTIGDAVMDGANILTGGLARKAANLIDDKASKIDYASLKNAKKTADKNGKTLDKSTQVGYLVNDNVADLDDFDFTNG